MLAASGQPKLWELTPVDARKMALELTRMVESKEAIGRIENSTMPGPGGTLAFRVYTPVGSADGPLAGIVYFHGGAWVFGDLDSHDSMCRMLANESGCRVISIDYRLAPEHKFPAAVEDAYAATQWVAAHASELSIDPARLAVAGTPPAATLPPWSATERKAPGRDLHCKCCFAP